jgi:hypothetical protein
MEGRERPGDPHHEARNPPQVRNAAGCRARRFGAARADRMGRRARVTRRLRPRVQRLGSAVRDPGAALGQQRLPEAGHGNRPAVRGISAGSSRCLHRQPARPDRRFAGLRSRPLRGHRRNDLLPEQLTGAGGQGGEVHRDRRRDQRHLPRRRRRERRPERALHGRLGARSDHAHGGTRPQRLPLRAGPHAIGDVARVVRGTVRIPHRHGTEHHADPARATSGRGDRRPRAQLPEQHRDRRRPARALRRPPAHGSGSTLRPRSP